MKVVYKSLLKIIRDLSYKADLNGRPIEYIELTEREARELASELGATMCTKSMVQSGDYYYGIEIRVKEQPEIPT